MSPRIVRIALALAAMAAMAAIAATARAEPPAIGRLFMTPAERASLDALRATGGRTAPQPPSVAQAQPEPAEAPVAAEPPAPPAPVVVTGIVKRSDGRSTVWINNVPQEDAAIAPDARSGAPSVTVPLPTGQQATVKAGQQVDVTTGEVRDAPTR